MELLVHLEKDSDLIQVEQLLAKLQVRYEKQDTKLSEKEYNTSDIEAIKKELRFLASKIKVSSFGDPLKFQRRIRKDKPLAFRN